MRRRNKIDDIRDGLYQTMMTNRSRYDGSKVNLNDPFTSRSRIDTPKVCEIFDKITDADEHSADTKKNISETKINELFYKKPSSSLFTNYF